MVRTIWYSVRFRSTSIVHILLLPYQCNIFYRFSFTAKSRNPSLPRLLLFPNFHLYSRMEKKCSHCCNLSTFDARNIIHPASRSFFKFRYSPQICNTQTIRFDSIRLADVHLIEKIRTISNDVSINLLQKRFESHGYYHIYTYNGNLINSV